MRLRISDSVLFWLSYETLDYRGKLNTKTTFIFLCITFLKYLLLTIWLTFPSSTLARSLVSELELRKTSISTYHDFMIPQPPMSLIKLRQ